jgi:hypothetical protein
MVGLHACVNLKIFRLNQERKLDIDLDVEFLALDFESFQMVHCAAHHNHTGWHC